MFYITNPELIRALIFFITSNASVSDKIFVDDEMTIDLLNNKSGARLYASHEIQFTWKNESFHTITWISNAKQKVLKILTDAPSSQVLSMINTANISSVEESKQWEEKILESNGIYI